VIATLPLRGKRCSDRKVGSHDVCTTKTYELLDSGAARNFGVCFNHHIPRVLQFLLEFYDVEWVWNA
jgi:hypothetical protein